MDQFGWGAEFLRVNADVLQTYSACADGAEVVKAQVRRDSVLVGCRETRAFQSVGQPCASTPLLERGDCW